MSIEINVKGSKVRFPGWSMTSFTTAWRRRAAPAVLEALKREAPVYKYDDPSLSRGQNKGDLRDSIKLLDAGRGEMTFSAVGYAKYVIDGTKGHAIPKAGGGGKRLHWVRNGESFYRESVWHPGTTANNFPRRAMDSVEALIGRTLTETVSELITPEED